MILYFAGESPVDNAVLEDSGVKNILKSYFYLKNNPKYTVELLDKFNVFLDSGAFSALTRKAAIGLDSYIEFLKEYKPPVYAGLDVIGNAQETKKNIEYMEERGLSPMPTFHRGSEMRHLLEMLDKGYDYIALGGIAVMGLSSKQRHMHLDRCWKKIRDRRPGLKVHGFGCSGEQIMKQYPWYSVDSTSWLAPVTYGREIDGQSHRDVFEEEMKGGNEFIHTFKSQQREALLKRSIAMFLKLEEDITKAHETHRFENLSQGDMFE